MRVEEEKTHGLQPKILPGYVRAERVRCGKKNCKCSKGYLHGPYFYHYTWVAGKRRKRYIKPADVGKVIVSCEMNRRFWRTLRQDRRQYGKLTSILREWQNERKA